MKRLHRSKIAYALIFSLVLLFCFAVFKYKDNFQYYSDIKIAKDFFRSTITNPKPPEDLVEILGERCKKDPEAFFYFFKIWFIEAEISDFDLKTAYIEYPVHKDGNRVIFNLYYKMGMPEILCDISNENNHKSFCAMFQLNNCLFDPDYNNDNKLDSLDVNLAKEHVEKTLNK